MALLFSMLFWVGVFDIVDDTLPAAFLNSTYTYLGMIILAFILMVGTGTLLGC